MTELAYDHRNRLLRVEQRTAAGAVLNVIKHGYDVFGRRSSRSVDPDGTGSLPAELSHTVYDGFSTWADLDASGQETVRYLVSDAIDKALARFRVDDGLAFYLPDAQGTVRDIVDGNGALINHVEYDSFGNVLAESDPSAGDRFKVTGREYDPELDLYYYRARYYDPGTGRFASQDPLGFEAGDYNLYRYTFNSPGKYTDPTGEIAALNYSFVGRSIFQRATMAALDCLGLSADKGIRTMTFYVLWAAYKPKKEGSPVDFGFYIGRTKDLDIRLNAHKRGKFVDEVVDQVTIKIPDII